MSCACSVSPLAQYLHLRNALEVFLGHGGLRSGGGWPDPRRHQLDSHGCQLSETDNKQAEREGEAAYLFLQFGDGAFVFHRFLFQCDILASRHRFPNNPPMQPVSSDGWSACAHLLAHTLREGRVRARDAEPAIVRTPGPASTDAHKHTHAEV